MIFFAFIRAYAQDGMLNILKSVEKNNLELKMLQKIAESEKLTNKAEFNLEDPTVGYVYLWEKDDPNIREDELTIEQSFLFPSLYFSQRDLNKLRTLAINGQYDISRQEILLKAQEICFDIILLRQQNSLLQKMHRNTKELCDIYCDKLKTGEVCEFEANKIRLELLNAASLLEQNRVELVNMLKDLQLINGNVPITFEDTIYPIQSMPADYEQLKSKILSLDLQLNQNEYENAITNQETELSRRNWWPSFALGYRRTSAAGHPANGFTASMSIPIFSNRFNVKALELQEESNLIRKENLRKTVETEILKQYNEALSLQCSITDYQKLFAEKQNCTTLRKALEKGELNMTDYFVELNEIYAVQLETQLLENLYQKVMANLLKFNL
jgi:Outer membrane protein